MAGNSIISNSTIFNLTHHHEDILLPQLIAAVEWLKEYIVLLDQYDIGVNVEKILKFSPAEAAAAEQTLVEDAKSVYDGLKNGTLEYPDRARDEIYDTLRGRIPTVECQIERIGDLPDIVESFQRFPLELATAILELERTFLDSPEEISLEALRRRERRKDPGDEWN